MERKPFEHEFDCGCTWVEDGDEMVVTLCDACDVEGIENPHRIPLVRVEHITRKEVAA